MSKFILTFLKRAPHRVTLILILVAGLSVSAAFIGEYFFEIKPCALCMYQRYVYAVVIIVCLASLFVRNIPHYTSAILITCGILFLVGAGLGGFQVGVEQKWWKGTESCGGDTSSVISIEDLRNMIENAPTVRCDEPSFLFLGITLAGWNIIYSLALAFMSFYSCGVLKKKCNTNYMPKPS